MALNVRQVWIRDLVVRWHANDPVSLGLSRRGLQLACLGQREHVPSPFVRGANGVAPSRAAAPLALPPAAIIRGAEHHPPPGPHHWPPTGFISRPPPGPHIHL